MNGLKQCHLVPLLPSRAVITPVMPAQLRRVHCWYLSKSNCSQNYLSKAKVFCRQTTRVQSKSNFLRNYSSKSKNKSRGRGGIATYRGMSAHPIIGGSALYLALKLCHKVAHNPNIDLLILTFACTYINKKLCLKMCFLRKLLLCASRTYILASSTINCAENVVMHFQTRV